MKTVRIELADGRAYDDLVGHDLLTEAGSQCRALGLGDRCALVYDQALEQTALPRVLDSLKGAGFEVVVIAFGKGERGKRLESVETIIGSMVEAGLDRGTWVAALGGGVVGDLAGFAAASFLRGVDVVQMPTTIVSQVDASLGGKTGVNIPTGKNLVGAFHQPKLVLQDVAHLKSLPAREMSAGWAEAVKHGFILDAQLLDMFERLAPQMKALEGEEPVEAIRRSVAIKGEIVSADEFETGDQRILLNYGHTVGHAIEKVSGYGTYLHGEAVAVGMMVAAGIAERLGMIDTELVDRQRRVLQSYDLPVRISELDVDELINATKSDKKSRGGTIRWVLLEGPGKATTRRDVPDDVVREAILSVLD